MQQFTIVLADDHGLFRDGLKRIIHEKSGLKVIGEAQDGLQLLHLLKDIKPMMVIMDIAMPNIRGIEATREVKRLYSDIKVMILTMYKDKDYLLHSLAAGADGYMLKEDADSELFEAIEAIRSGRTYVSPLLFQEMADTLQKLCTGTNTKMPTDDQLTTREKEVLQMIAEGKSNKDAADLLSISIRTVQHHRISVMEKLNLKKTTELVKYAIRKGYTTLHN